MNHKMRKSEREISKEEAMEILVSGEYGILSTVSEDGTPYGVPVNYGVKDEKIYFHCAKDAGHKVENIRHEKRVCFTVVGNTSVLPSKFSTKYESVIVFGTAREVVAGKEEPLMTLIKKYSADFQEKGMRYIESDAEKTGVYEITIEKITGKARR